MRERRNTYLAVSAVLLFMVFLGVALTGEPVKDTGGKDLSARPANGPEESCTGCHELTPEVLTWQVSSHSKISCTSCHDIDTSRYNSAHSNAGQPVQEKKSLTVPIKMADAISNAVCEQCHTSNREATVSGDLIIPHDRHSAAGVLCVKCHSGVVHAKIADRELTVKGRLSDLEAWNVDEAKKVSTKYYLQPSMWVCLECHRGANVTRKCSACHTSIDSLPSHDAPTWKADHGKTARTGIGDCTKCHVIPGERQFITPSTGDIAADFARAQSFCYRCHLVRPEMHGESMLSIHPAKVVERGIQNCLTCHDKTKPEPGRNITATYCNQCHWL